MNTFITFNRSCIYEEFKVNKQFVHSPAFEFRCHWTMAYKRLTIILSERSCKALDRSIGVGITIRGISLRIEPRRKAITDSGEKDRDTHETKEEGRKERVYINEKRKGRGTGWRSTIQSTWHIVDVRQGWKMSAVVEEVRIFLASRYEKWYVTAAQGEQHSVVGVHTLGERFLRVVRWEGGASMLDRYSLARIRVGTATIPCKACISKPVLVVLEGCQSGKTVGEEPTVEIDPETFPLLSFPFVYSFTLVASPLTRLGEFPREWNRDWSSFDECCWYRGSVEFVEHSKMDDGWIADRNFG